MKDLASPGPAPRGVPSRSPECDVSSGININKILSRWQHRNQQVNLQRALQYRLELKNRFPARAYMRRLRLLVIRTLRITRSLTQGRVDKKREPLGEGFPVVDGIESYRLYYSILNVLY